MTLHNPNISALTLRDLGVIEVENYQFTGQRRYRAVDAWGGTLKSTDDRSEAIAAAAPYQATPVMTEATRAALDEMAEIRDRFSDEGEDGEDEIMEDAE